MLKTPKNPARVTVLAIALYLTAPFIEWYYFSSELNRGAFPIDADSIFLPFSMFMIGWLVGAPFVAFFIWFTLRSYPGCVSLFNFNLKRPYWSVFWSMLFAVPIFYYLFFAIQSIYRLHPLDVLQALLIAYLLLCLRSSIIHSELFIANEPASTDVA